MRTSAQKLVRTGVISSGVLILLLFAGTVGLILNYMRATRWVNHTTEVIAEIRGSRGLLPGTPMLSDEVLRVKVSSILDQFGKVAELTRDNPVQQRNAADFRAIFSGLGPGGIRTAYSPSEIAAADALLDRMQHEEEGLLIQRVEVQAQATRDGALLGCVLCLVLLILGATTGLALSREFQKRAAAEAALLRDKNELTRYTQELALVSAGSRMIQAARDEEQVNVVVAQVMRELVPGSSGYFGVVSPSSDIVEICCYWGDVEPPSAFLPSECLALQLGRPIHRSESRPRVDCAHVRQIEGDYACIPVQGPQGQIGVLHAAAAATIDTQHSDGIGLFAAHVGLGLTNLRMREALRSQTVRNALTGLFNRRYFDETLRRELAVAARNNMPLAVLMMDIDHFKKLNDAHGHAAGDDALRVLGQLIRSSFREGDVACRYGGEEFGVILPGADLKQAGARAESLRKRLAETDLGGEGTSHMRITISIGVAGSEEFQEPETIVRAADTALYQAKRMGRNATWVCSDRPGMLPSIGVETAGTGRRARR